MLYFKTFLLSFLVFSDDSNLKNLTESMIKYQKSKSLTAEFVQKQENLVLGTTKESSGRIFIKHPNSFRWQTLEPEPMFIVGNGKKVWIYQAPIQKDEKGRVTIKKASDLQSQLIINLLAGKTQFKKEFNVSNQANNPYHYNLKPKEETDVESFDLILEKSTKLVYKLILHSKLGQKTEITFKNVVLGPKLPDSMFVYKTLPNTEVIE